MKDLPGFTYDAKRKRVSLDGFVSGTEGQVRRRKTITNVTRDEAVVHWKMFRAELKSGRAVAGPLTFRRFIDTHYEAIASHLARSTRAMQRTIIKNHLVRYFGDVKLETITAVRVMDFMADMRARRRSPVYINNAVRVLKMLLRQAVERDLIAEYPIRKRVPKEKEKPLQLELDREERESFFAVFHDEARFRAHLAEKRTKGPVKHSSKFATPRRFGGSIRPDSNAAHAAFIRFQELFEFFVVAIESGLRRSDLRTLRRDQVDFPAGVIRVITQKTGLVAVIPISRACRAALLAVGRRVGGGEHVFRHANGRLYSLTRIRRTFVLAKQLAGIKRRFRPHDLRHSYASRLASAAVPLQIIARSLGHASIRMSERYARPSEEAMRVIVTALDGDPCGIP